jgi:hypothetical protein
MEASAPKGRSKLYERISGGNGTSPSGWSKLPVTPGPQRKQPTRPLKFACDDRRLVFYSKLAKIELKVLEG